MQVVAANATEVLKKGFTNAMEIATHLAMHGAHDFRGAHSAVGRLVTQAVEGKTTNLLELDGARAFVSPQDNLDHLNPDAIAAASNAGGGPGYVSRRRQ